MGVLLQGLHRLGDIPCVPELHLAVISAAGEVILLVGVEVEVTHQLPMSVLYAVYLAGRRTHTERGSGLGNHLTSPGLWLSPS